MNQNYTTKAEDEYVIRGNDVIVKCKVPSFVSDYIQVVAEAQFRGLTYSIFDIQGKLIHSGNMQNQGSTRIDVSQFSTGMYAIQISDSSKGIVAKKIFVKE